MTSATQWANGDPVHLANAFFEATSERGKSLGTKMYMLFVTAMAGAAVHNIVCQTMVIDHVVRQQAENILLTAKEVGKIVSGQLADDEFEDEEVTSSDGEVDNDAENGTDALETLTTAVKELLWTNSGDEYLAPYHTSLETSSALARGSSSAAELAYMSFLPVPHGVLEIIFSRLDVRSAAAAASSCRQLRAAHRLVRFFSLSAPFVAYLTAMRLLQQGDDFSDGSVESEFCTQFPVDGSPACGRDLAADTYKRRMLNLLPQMSQLFELLGGGPNGRSLAEFKQSLKGDGVSSRRPPPHPRSSPLASFKNAQRVPLLSAADAAGPSTSDGRTAAAGGSDDYSSSFLGPVCCLRDAICDVFDVPGVPQGRLHADGDLLVVSYGCGWKGRDPGLSAAVLSLTGDQIIGDSKDYSPGLFDFVTRQCADAANGLVWAAADNGRRIKAFRAPLPPLTNDAACNRGERNGEDLQYTFSTEVPGRRSGHAGLHVMGTRVMSVKDDGMLLLWDISDLPAQAAYRPARRLPGHSSSSSSYDGDDDADDEDGPGRRRGGSGGGGGGDEVTPSEPAFTADLGFRDTEDPQELEVTVGTRPRAVSCLRRPATWGQPSAATLLADIATASGYDTGIIRTTCLLGAGAGAGAGPAGLVAALTGNIIVSYDLETQRVRQCWFGHMYEITDVVAAPAGWGQAGGGGGMFATCSRAGDVKVWDVRMRSGAAAVTLTTGGTDPMNAVVLASTAEGGGAGGAGGGGDSLGAGMVCFAGGEGESIWAWDLRGGHAQPLYELSTGNTSVRSLVWHEAGRSLIASCDSSWENRLGGFARDDWRKVPVPAAAVGEGGGGGNDDDDDDWEEGDGGALGEEGPDVSGDSSEDDDDDDDGDDDMMEEDDDKMEEDDKPGPQRRRRGGGGSGGGGGGGDGGGPAAAGGGGGGGPMRRRWWPTRAQHQPTDFDAYLNLAQSCVLRYYFSEQPTAWARRAPESVAPTFGYW